MKHTDLCTIRQIQKLLTENSAMNWTHPFHNLCDLHHHLIISFNETETRDWRHTATDWATILCVDVTGLDTRKSLKSRLLLLFNETLFLVKSTRSKHCLYHQCVLLISCTLIITIFIYILISIRTRCSLSFYLQFAKYLLIENQSINLKPTSKYVKNS